MKIQINNNQTLYILSDDENECVYVNDTESEIMEIPYSELVMLLNYYRNCKDGTDYISSDYISRRDV